MQNENDNNRSNTEIQNLFNGHSTAGNPFGNNFAAAHIYARSERLLAAIYLLTKSIPANETGRIRIRELSVRLLETIAKHFQTVENTERANVKDILLILREIISLSRTLAVAGYLSSNNLSILLQALSDFAGYIDKNLATALEFARAEYTVSKDDFVPMHKLQKQSEMRSVISSSWGAGQFVGAGTMKREITTLKKDSVSTSAPSHDRDGASLGRGDQARRQIIIDLIATRGVLGIKDIASHIVGVSEKTVQRELVALVADGILAKRGQKRWSTYSLSK